MITDSLQKLKQIKKDIKSAIIRKGGDAGADFTTYADSIKNLNNEILIIPKGLKFGNTTLEKLPVEYDWSDSANWNDFSNLFYECRNLKEFPKFEVDSATTMESMFEWSGNGTAILDISHWKNSLRPNVRYMFSYANFKDIKFSNDFKLKDLTYMFYNYQGKKLDLSDYDMSDVTDLQYTFYNSELEELILPHTPNLKSIRNAFGLSGNLRKLSAVDCPYIWDAQSAFNGLSALKDFGGLIGLDYSVTITGAYSLSYESLLNILNGLKEVKNNHYLELDQENVNMLTDEDIAIATNKGWIVSPAKTISEKITVQSLSDLPTNLERIHPRVYDLQNFSGEWADQTTKKSKIPCSTNLTTAEISLKSTTDASYMFGESYVYHIILNDTSNVESMKGAFRKTYFLKSLTMTDDVSKLQDVSGLFEEASSTGTFYYNPEYDYSKIINELPENWVAKPIE